MRPQRDSSGQGVLSQISKEAPLQPTVPRGFLHVLVLLLNNNISEDDILGRMFLDIKKKKKQISGPHPILGASWLVMISVPHVFAGNQNQNPIDKIK